LLIWSHQRRSFWLLFPVSSRLCQPNCWFTSELAVRRMSLQFALQSTRNLELENRNHKPFRNDNEPTKDLRRDHRRFGCLGGHGRKGADRAGNGTAGARGWTPSRSPARPQLSQVALRFDVPRFWPTRLEISRTVDGRHRRRIQQTFLREGSRAPLYNRPGKTVYVGAGPNCRG